MKINEQYLYKVNQETKVVLWYTGLSLDGALQCEVKHHKENYFVYLHPDQITRKLNLKTLVKI